ncbi:hypothetical protein MKY29_20465 [Psychrobacillus sp. FSL K6-2365]|uniref:hypothetical protein n=1 Tax=Psychrobacillus sp. FSL K6-2365 TaxID=2921546 RepID=UPI0030FBF06F
MRTARAKDPGWIEAKEASALRYNQQYIYVSVERGLRIFSYWIFAIKKEIPT